jgi:glycosyltransferase involved in cell wall biosynthesis
MTKQADSSDQALRVAAAALGHNDIDWTSLSGDRLIDSVIRAVGHPDPSVVYLLISCLTRTIPTAAEIADFARRWRIQGLGEPLRDLYKPKKLRSRARVRVEAGTIVDVTDTGRSTFTTGIQRVARETLTRWARDRDLVLVSWEVGNLRLLDSSDEEVGRVVLDKGLHARIRRFSTEVVVPFGATFVLPEIAVDGHRAENIRTISRFSRSTATAIGFDCIPITTAETSGPGMPGAFSKYLSTLAQFDAVATISSAATTEYLGWKGMLAGAGLAGPEVREVALPAQVEAVSEETVAATRDQLGLGDEAVVLAVGSHEPRKNHLNLLLAAEMNWRAGREFTLVMVGGNAWGDHEFKHFASVLRRRGRRVITLSGVDDDVVWSLYRIARLSVFCSVNEGFGLPVVESLASGTPVITSDFGSMRELGEGHGALVVNPHVADDIAAALSTLLDNDEELARLEAETALLPRPTWDDYAAAVWDLVYSTKG